MADLMLHFSAFEQFPKLPSKVQKKLVELVHKFKVDSTQASIHLEPLQPMVRDKKVRSARLGNDYRAIVIAPESGETYVLIHIDHHDKAYRWCKNKLFEAHQELGAFQIVNVEEVERIAEEVKASPSYQTRPTYRLNNLTDEDLFHAGAPKALIPSIKAVQSDDDFEKMAEYLPKEAKQVLYGYVCGLSLNESIAEMLGEQDQVTLNGPGDFSHLHKRANIDLVLVEGEEHLQDILSKGIEAWRIFLHPYQKKLVGWNVNGPMKINGAAGTGKTVVLMHRAVYLASKLRQHETLLITTFTTNLAITIRHLLRDMAPQLLQKIVVKNLDKLAFDVCKDAGVNVNIVDDEMIHTTWSSVFDELSDNIEFSQQYIKDEFDQVVNKIGLEKEEDYLTVLRTGRPRLIASQRRVLWPYFQLFRKELVLKNKMTFSSVISKARKLLETRPHKKYRHILVDELQDFGLDALKLLRELSPIDEGRNNPLCLVGDGHQRLYSSLAIPLSHAGINVVGRSRRLKINYRTTEQIRALAQTLLNGVSVDDLDGNQVETVGDRSVFSGSDPLLVNVENYSAAAQTIINWLSGLIESGVYKSHEICVTPLLPKIANKISSAGFSTVELKGKQLDNGESEVGIRLGSKKRIKGLEFKAVAVILNDEASTNSVDKFEDYVAVTRAREQLLLIKINKRKDA